MNDDRVYILDIYNRGIYPHDGYAKSMQIFYLVVDRSDLSEDNLECKSVY